MPQNGTIPECHSQLPQLPVITNTSPTMRAGAAFPAENSAADTYLPVGSHGGTRTCTPCSPRTRELIRIRQPADGPGTPLPLLRHFAEHVRANGSEA